MKFEEFSQICMGAVALLRQLAPKDTGNLAFNGVQFKWIDKETFEIYMDKKIAPYMPYTNEPWIAERWKEKKNPNEGWFDAAAHRIATFVTQQLGGELQ